jgi:hypothetical protein
MRRAGSAHSLAFQAIALDRLFPGGDVEFKGNRLLWTADLQPSADSRSYTARVIYRIGKHPKVKILAPGLDTGLAQSLPHVFQHDNLCLYRDGEWTSNELIAETIVPWTSEWLFYYEIWKFTGEWHGGGDWPPVDR